MKKFKILSFAVPIEAAEYIDKMVQEAQRPRSELLRGWLVESIKETKTQQTDEQDPAHI